MSEAGPIESGVDETVVTRSGAVSRDSRRWRACAMFMLVLSFIVLAPFAPWFVLASWFATAVRPLLLKLAARLGGRGRAGAALTLALLVAVCAPLVFAITALTLDAIHLGQRIAGSGSSRDALAALVSTDATPGAQSGPVLAHVLEQHGEQAVGFVAALANLTLEGVLGLFVFFSAAYFFLVEDVAIRRWVHEHAPIDRALLGRLDDAFQETGRGLFIGIGITALAQAALATLVYAALGVPRALVLGLVTFVAALVPGVGTGLVWIPIAVGLALSGRTTAAIILFVIGIVLIGTIDNVVRPYLTRWGKLEVHPFVVMVSMLGGLALIGGWGIVMGPLIVRITLEVLAIARPQSPE